MALKLVFNPTTGKLDLVNASTGDVIAPATNTDNYIPQWNGANSKTLKDGLAFSTNTSLGTSDTIIPSQNAVKTYADSLVAGLLDYRGAYDASGNTYPTTGGSGTAGAVLKGDLWIISVAGVLGGEAVQVGDSIIAKVDTPAQTASNWNHLNANISYVPEDSANKENSVIDTSATKYPTVNLLKTGLGTKMNNLTPVTTKTANYSANANELVPCDISAGGFVVTLPTSPADGTLVQVMITVVGTGTLEIKCGGTDTFWKAGGTQSAYLSLNLESATMQYQASTGIWFSAITAVPYNFANNFTGIDATTPITDSDISINTTTRELTITPPLGYFRFLVDGNGKVTRYRKTSEVTFPAFTDTSGTWFFYFDSSGNPITTQTAWSSLSFNTICPVYRILWNSTLYSFTVTAANATVGTTYTNSGKTYTVLETIAGGTTLKMSCPTGNPAVSGTLTKTGGGAGDATITYSAFSEANKLVAQYIEYHVNDIPADTHQWMHLYGAIWGGGTGNFDIKSNLLASGAPNADGRNTVIGITSGYNIDDNLEYSVTNDSTPTDHWQQDLGDIVPATLNSTNSGLFKTFVQDASSNISFLPATRFPFPWDTATNRPQYITSTGVRTLVTNQRFFVVFVYATQNPVAGEAIKIVTATSDFTTINNARAFNWVDIQNAYSIIANDFEIRPMYRLIFEAHNAAPNVYDAGCKYSVLRETQDIRKTVVSSTTTIAGSLPASSVTNVPNGAGISSTNVQAALDELDSEKAPLASPIFTGTVETPAIKITTGAGLGKILTSDADGDATWETLSSGSFPINIENIDTDSVYPISSEILNLTTSNLQVINFKKRIASGWFQFRIPTSWDSTKDIKFDLVFVSEVANNNAYLQLDYYVLTDGAVTNPVAFTATKNEAIVCPTATNKIKVVTTSTLIVANADFVAGDMLICKLSRQGTHANDTNTGSFYLSSLTAYQS